MKRFLAAALLFAAPVIAQDPFLTGDALDAAVKEQCAAGCIVFTREDAARLEAAIKSFAQQAYSAGIQAGRESCGVRRAL